MLGKTSAGTGTGATVNWLERAAAISGEIEQQGQLHDKTGSFVAEAYDILKREGFFKAMVPVELGGSGATVGEMCAAIRRLGAACGSTALSFSMHCHLVAVAAWRWRHQNAPTDGLLRRVAAEDLVLVSSGGSDWLPSGGVAKKVEGGFRINARKPFSSGCVAGDLLMTSAVYDDPAAGATVLHFGVPMKAEGVRIDDTWHVMGMRGTGSHDIVLTDVFVPDAGIAGRRPHGLWHPLFHTISMIAFSLVYAAYLGVAEGARARALEIARNRPNNEILPYAVGEMENALMMAVLAHQSMVDIAETGTPGAETTSRAMAARTIVGRCAIDTVTKAMEVAGGSAFFEAWGLERAFRDIQGARFHPLQEKPQLRFTGLVALGWDIDAPA